MSTESESTELFKKANVYLDKHAVTLLKKAFNLANKAHEGQVRHSKKPYIVHPIAVARILCELEQSLDTVIAGLLHDTIEDTDLTGEEIQDSFGVTVRSLVEGVTKLKKLSFHSKQEAQVENYRRLFIAMADDYRVIIIKLADRLHNMRTLNFLPAYKQRRIAQETLDIYAPLAHRLGIYSIKWQLEDLGFCYTKPEQFQELKEHFDVSKKRSESELSSIIQAIKRLLKKESISCKVLGRSKHLYSIFQKLGKKQNSLADIYDLHGIRVILDSVKDCYAALGIIHAEFKPISERFKDYIALPKTNGYQSIHSTVLTPEGKPIEVQLRTLEMHHTAEFGFAAHWQYKQNAPKKQFDEKMKWLNTILEHQNEALAPQDFLQTLKFDLFVDEVFVFTPKGDLKVLSGGATALDFAYSIHTEVGHSCKNILVNGKIVPLGHVLENGDQVEILTSKHARPNIDWLKLVSSRHSRYKIKQYLNTQQKSASLISGKQRVHNAFLELGIVFEDTIHQIGLNTFKQRFQLSKLDDIYLYIEQGDISIRELKRYITTQTSPSTQLKKSRSSSSSKQSDSIIVSGAKGTKYTLAKCCRPIPGDDITGIIVIGKGVSIHRHDCLNLSAVRNQNSERLVDVEWDNDLSSLGVYTCRFRIDGYDREGLLHDLLTIIYASKLTLKEVKTYVNKNNTTMSATFSIELGSSKEFYQLRQQLLRLEDVSAVTRMSLGLES